jgi:hypothetical protein
MLRVIVFGVAPGACTDGARRGAPIITLLDGTGWPIALRTTGLTGVVMSGRRVKFSGFMIFRPAFALRLTGVKPRRGVRTVTSTSIGFAGFVLPAFLAFAGAAPADGAWGGA